MFEVLDGLDGRGVADALDANHRADAGRRAFELLLVTGWADVHNEDSVPTDARGRVLPGMEQVKAYGGDGTPRVAEFATAELAPLLATTVQAADNLLRDGLDLRHRHPALWARVEETARLAVLPGPALTSYPVTHVDPGTGALVDLPTVLDLEGVEPVAVWQARQIAQACHAAGLSLEQARWVDEVTTPLLGRVPFRRFENILGAAIIEADPGAAEARAKAEALRQHVTLGRSDEAGLITLVVRARAGDMITAKAMIDRLAEILALEGDPEGDSDPVEVRQARAAALLLANPYRAVALLLKHAVRTDDDHTDANPARGSGPATGDGPAGGSGPAAGDGSTGRPGQGVARRGRSTRRRHPRGDYETVYSYWPSGHDGFDPADFIDPADFKAPGDSSDPGDRDGPGGSGDLGDLSDLVVCRPVDWREVLLRPDCWPAPPPQTPPDEALPGWAVPDPGPPDDPTPEDPGQRPVPDQTPAPPPRPDTGDPYSGLPPPAGTHQPGTPTAPAPDVAPLPLHPPTEDISGWDMHPCVDDADDPCPTCDGTGHARTGTGYPGVPPEAALITALADAIRTGRLNPDKLFPTTTLYVHLSAHALWHTLHPHAHPGTPAAVAFGGPTPEPTATDRDQAPDETDLEPGAGDGEACPYCATGEPVPAAARVEGRIGPVLLDQVRQWLAHRRVTVKPVVDLNENQAVDCHEVPAWMAEALNLAQPASVWPYSASTSRRNDADHTLRFARNADGTPAEPGQTRLDNLGGLERRTHRVKTHRKGWRVYQPRRGVYLWRSPHGHWYRVDNTGTHRLGTNPDLTQYDLGPDKDAGDDSAA